VLSEVFVPHKLVHEISVAAEGERLLGVAEIDPMSGLNFSDDIQLRCEMLYGD